VLLFLPRSYKCGAMIGRVNPSGHRSISARKKFISSAACEYRLKVISDPFEWPMIRLRTLVFILVLKKMVLVYQRGERDERVRQDKE
jgi:hypothetical protein